MLKIIAKRLLKNNFETSVLLAFKQDKRVFNLLKALGKQEYKNFVVLIANDSEEPFLKDKDIPKNLSYVYYHSKEGTSFPYDKINFLGDKVRTKFVAITETDCEPSPGWLRELVPLVKDKIVIKGCEARPIGCCTANLVFKSDVLKKVKFDEINAPLIADYEWGMALEKAGYKLDFQNDKGLVFHNTLTGKPRFNRIIPAARDEVSIAFKHKNPGFLWHKILRNFYNIFNSVCLTLLYIFFVPYFFVKRIFKKV